MKSFLLFTLPGSRFQRVKSFRSYCSRFLVKYRLIWHYIPRERRRNLDESFEFRRSWKIRKTNLREKSSLCGLAWSTTTNSSSTWWDTPKSASKNTLQYKSELLGSDKPTDMPFMQILRGGVNYLYWCKNDIIIRFQIKPDYTSNLFRCVIASL